MSVHRSLVSKNTLKRQRSVLTRAERPPGRHAIAWDGRDSRGAAVASGIYFCVLEARGTRLTSKLVIAR